MYGMINDAIKQMVTERYGEAAWSQMHERAAADDDYMRMGQYPDEMTYRLVEIATEMLGATAAEVLRTFGDYWIDYAGEAYGELMALSGDTFIDTVENLDAMHTRVGQMLPHLIPPSFMVTDRSGENFTLHYHSKREGLAPMVVGLLEGLGRRYDTEVEVAHTVVRDNDNDHDEFRVIYRSR